MTEQEKRLLIALSLMCQQYLGDHDNDHLDHLCMVAGEEAVELLIQYGLVTPGGRGGTWTEAGLRLLDTRAI